MALYMGNLGDFNPIISGQLWAPTYNELVLGGPWFGREIVGCPGGIVEASSASFHGTFCGTSWPKKAIWANDFPKDTVDGWNPAPVEVGSLSHYL